MTKNEKQAHALNIMDELIRLELKGASSNDAAKQAFDNWQARVNCNESENNTIKKYIFNHRASAEKLYFRKRLKPSNRSTLTNQYKALFLGLIRSGVSNASAVEMSARKIKDDTSLSVEEARYCLFLIEELNTKKRSVPKNNKESYADNKIFNCSKCDRKFMNEQALNFHKSDEHAENHNSYSNNHSRKNLQDVVVENKAIAAEPNPRLSVPSEDHGESNRPFRAYFNANAYSQALMKMTQPEAWKLAINEEESNIFLSVTLEAYAHSSVTSTSIKENEKDPAVIKENHLNHEDVKATSRTVEVNTTVRHAGDQADFKARVKSNFNGRCAVTGYYLPDGIVEAAHIEDNALAGNMNTSNGLYLEVNLHRMFDRGLMGINPDSLTVHFAIDCLHKAHYEGCTLQPHSIALDIDKLNAKWGEYIKR